MLLSLSILIRLGSAAWSLVLLRRVRDRRMGFLTAMLLLMALRQVLSLSERAGKVGVFPALATVDFTELPGLAVSVLAAVATAALARVILDVREVATTLRERDAQLAQSQKMDALGQLAGGVAHDFNNLLTIILTNVELAAPHATGEVSESLSAIDQAARSASVLTRRLLALARREVIDARVVDLRAQLEGFYPMLRTVLPESLELSLEPGTTVWPVEVDPARIEQVLINLVANARDALGPHGHVRVGVGNCTVDAPAAARLNEVKPGDYVCLWVEDDGEGMSAEVKARIFEPFFTTKPAGRGTGLGLPICNGIARQMGGHLDVHSEPGKGTRIEVRLPRTQKRLETGAVPALRSVAPGGRERVLLVEDEPRLREALVLMLRAHGYRVTTAANGADALALGAEVLATIELLLTDVVMPQMGGEQLAQELRRRHPGLPVLFMSGYSPSHVAGTAPAGELLQKPFDQLTLLTRVRASLEERVATPVGAAANQR